MTHTEDTVEQYKEHCDKPLNPMDLPFLKEPVPGISGVLEPIYVAKLTMPVRNLKSRKTAGMDDMLKALYKLGVLYGNFSIFHAHLG